VFTTTAKDYITWKNEYPPGETLLNGVTIKRFKVMKKRDMNSFNKFSDWIFSHEHSYEDEIEWMENQGPLCPGLIDAIEREEMEQDIFIFFTYLYYNTYWGLRRLKGKKVLVPTAHDELPLYLGIMKEVFSAPDAFLFNTVSEKKLLSHHFSFDGKYQDTVGVGVEIPSQLEASSFIRNYGIINPFVLYAGRIEKGKGCQELIENFLKYSRMNSRLTLILIGERMMDLPSHPNVRYLGFLSPEEKNAAMASALITVHPSQLESLCMSALESLAVQTPILVQARTEPLRHHCLDGQCGLYYESFDEFKESLDLVFFDPKLRRVMGKKGLNYVRENYAWPKIVQKYSKLFDYFYRETHQSE
jgi:glycosyltransferase involved in cell wall biosynthesis